MKKQPETTDRTRQAFLDTFCKLYMTKPIEKISVQEITSKSGYNRSTFYKYFYDIYDLLEYIENDVLEYLRDKSKTINDNPPLQELICFFEEKGMYLNALLGDYGNIRFVEKIKSQISVDEERFGFSKDSPITPYLLEFHVSTSLSLFQLWQRRGKDLPQEKLLELLHTLFMSGVSSFIQVK